MTSVKVLISFKSYLKLKKGSILRSPTEKQRKNLGSKSGMVCFKKVRSSEYPQKETYYNWYDIKYKYKIIKF